MIRRILLVTAGCLLAACVDRAPEPPPGPDAAAPDASWRTNPADAQVARVGESLRLTTGSHVVAWDPALPELAPPYLVTATLQKHSGRLHEGVGLIFGGTGLEGPEAAQVYSYFLVRGDGSFLVKKRQGATTPVVRDWTRHPAIRRDTEDGAGRPNDLAVVVADTLVVFQVNGVEVARVPAAELSLRGRAGLRVSHDVELSATGFRAGAIQ